MKFILVAVMCLGVALGQTYEDVTPDHWAYNAVEEASELGILLGFPDGNFYGAREVTRFELALILSRLTEVFETTLAGVMEAQSLETLEL